MRRVARPLFTILAALSLLFCVAIVILWVRSYRISDQLGWTGQARTVAILSSDGSVGFYADKLNASTATAGGRPMGMTHYHLRQPLSLTDPHFGGVTPRGRGGFVIARGENGSAGDAPLVVRNATVAAVRAAAGTAVDLAHSAQYAMRLAGLRKLAAAALALCVIGGGISAVMLATMHPRVASTRSVPHITLVTSGNYFLEQGFKATGRPLHIVSPRNYTPADGAADLVVFDRWTPTEMPASRNIMWFDTLPPGRRIRPAAAQSATVPGATARVIRWQRDHPLLRGMNLTSISTTQPMKLDLPASALVLIDGNTGPLLLLDREAETTNLILTFPIADSTWPLKSSFPIFLYNVVNVLAPQIVAEPARAPITVESPGKEVTVD